MVALSEQPELERERKRVQPELERQLEQQQREQHVRGASGNFANTHGDSKGQDAGCIEKYIVW